MTGSARPRLVLIGGGHASVAVLAQAGQWTRRGVRVTLVSDARHLTYSGMIPETVGGHYEADAPRIDLLRLCLEARVAFVEDAAVRIDLATRTVHTAGGERVEGDFMALDVGGANREADARGDALPTKPSRDLEGLYGWAERAARGEAGPLVMVGGGAAGTELMLNLSARVSAHPAGGAVPLTLAEPSWRLVPEFPAGLARRAEKLLRDRGVDVRLNTAVESAPPREVRLKGGASLPREVAVWATGAVGHPLVRASGLPADDKGYLRVDGALRCEGAPWLLGAGDAVTVRGAAHLARAGVHAVKQGKTLRANLDLMLRASLAGKDPTAVRLHTFRPYWVAPYLMSTGAAEGLMAAGPLWARGAWVLRLKHLLDRRWVRRYRR